MQILCYTRLLSTLHFITIYITVFIPKYICMILHLVQFWNDILCQVRLDQYLDEKHTKNHFAESPLEIIFYQ